LAANDSGLAPEDANGAPALTSWIGYQGRDIAPRAGRAHWLFSVRQTHFLLRNRPVSRR
jgi:hypothetical protein